jgi:mgtE-like transporter
MTVYSFRKIIKESFWLLTICILIEIVAGQALNSQEDIINIPLILAAIPVVNGIGGNLGSILGARITSGMHVGYIKPDIRDKTLMSNIVAILLLAIAVFIILVILMIIILPLTGIELSLPGESGAGVIYKFTIIVIGAGLILTLTVIVIGIISAFWAFKRGMDPDNVVTPITTTSGDFIGITIVIILVILMVV